MKKTKDAKRMRKRKENQSIYSKKATSTQIRENIKKNVVQGEEIMDKVEKEVDLEEIKKRLKKNKFTTKSFPKKSLNRRY